MITSKADTDRESGVRSLVLQKKPGCESGRVVWNKRVATILAGDWDSGLREWGNTPNPSTYTLTPRVINAPERQTGG